MPESAAQDDAACCPEGRCPWPGADAQYITYHDTEWGVPQRDGHALFEKLVLESFQAGLSWITILRKRANFRAAFANFEPAVIAQWGDAEVERLMTDPGIVRNRAKIVATIANARAFNALGGAEPFAHICWQSVDGRPQQNSFATMADVPAVTPASTALAKRLKAVDFKFFGPTTAYAFMQSMGMVNDHLTTCARHAACAALAEGFALPGTRP